MKTLIYLTTLLVLTIQVMVNGQTQGNRTYKIRMDIMGAKEPVKMHYTNSNITMSEAEYKELKEHANSLSITAQKLRKEAEVIQEQALTKQIEASQLSSQIAQYKFAENKKTILIYLNNTPETNDLYTSASSANSESERYMKLAIEMREEANAQANLQAKLGNMSNAEEKEALALNIQEKILTLFEKSKFILTDNNVETKSSFVTTSHYNEVELLMNSLQEASTQAENLKLTAEQIRNTATTVSPQQKNILINEAIVLEKDYVAKKIEISNLKAKLVYQKFEHNKSVINELLMKYQDDKKELDDISKLISESERLMKIGKEMREEANAQTTVAAKYGAMSNAEEKELMAVNIQQESIQLIEKQAATPVLASKF